MRYPLRVAVAVAIFWTSYGVFRFIGADHSSALDMTFCGVAIMVLMDHMEKGNAR